MIDDDRPDSTKSGLEQADSDQSAGHRAGPQRPRVAVLCGGVGAARYLRGLLAVVPATSISAIVNTGDDTVLNGLSISPDLDTIVYTTSDAIDPDRGWGLAGETWRAMQALARYTPVRPDSSKAAVTWFNLGDADLATHLYRTTRLGEGAPLTTVTDEIARAWGVEFSVLPMTDQRLSTRLTVDEGDRRHEVSFQDYFVRLRHSVPVESVRFDSDGAVPTAAVIDALETADVIVIAPSNPVVSIGPIRALPGIDDLLAARRDTVVAISPIVDGAALKGPADRLLEAIGVEASVVGVAEQYHSIAASLIIDPADAELADAVTAAGMVPVVVPSVMSTPEIAADLAQATILAVDPATRKGT